MTIYIALLRGINVGGHNKIKMADLKHVFEAMGLSRVQTYIQSGNVLFESEEELEPLRARIEYEIERLLSMSLTVVLRTSSELDQIIQNCPFSEETLLKAEASSDVETFYVSLLLESPAQQGIEQLRALASERDEFRIQGRDIYLLLREGVRNSELANNLSKLNVPFTTRNWKTMNKLNALARAMHV